MAGRIPMGSGNGIGRRQDVSKIAPAIGAARTVRAYTLTQKLRDNRRTQIQGGGSSFGNIVRRHPFLAGMGGTLIAINTIQGSRTTGGY